MTFGNHTANRQTMYINPMYTDKYTTYCIQCGFSLSMPKLSATARCIQLNGGAN